VLHEGKKRIVLDGFVTVQSGSFAVGKQIRDILWPANLFVLSVKHCQTRDVEVDEHGNSAIGVGDMLHIRYSTFDHDHTKDELIAIVGEQSFDEHTVRKV
jgi:hypothetical protein